MVESTVSPGTTEGLVIPHLEETSGLRLNDDLFVGVCPERVMPGRLLTNLRTVPRTCGISATELGPVMVELYSSIVDAELDVTDLLTAELVKVTENTYRDVQIAFANEVSMICDDLGVDVWKLRELVNKVPFRNMHRPGGGVGGHCLPKDPWLLAAAPHQSQLRLIPAARQVNDAMPLHIANQLVGRIELWKAANGITAPISVAVLGFSYLPESDDVRNSPSRLLIDELGSLGFEVKVHDPFVDEYKGPVKATLEGCQAVVVMVPHREYDELELDLPGRHAGRQTTMSLLEMPSGARVFITGGAGFIGSRLALRCMSANSVTIYDTFARGSADLGELDSHPNVTIVKGDVSDRATLESAMAGHDIVFHCAAVLGVTAVRLHPTKVLNVNVLGSAAVLEAATTIDDVEPSRLLLVQRGLRDPGGQREGKRSNLDSRYR